jgi:16S rRNA (cytosine1402-N4)-methyltransferase
MNSHRPVMLSEVLAMLAPRDSGCYLDGTFGGGGYARAILERAHCTLWAIDRDPEAITRGAALAARFPGHLHLLHGRLGSLLSLLADSGVARLDGVVLDLGVSSFQLDSPERGFSFCSEGPLDMRMGQDGPTATELVATMSERELAHVLRELGEERYALRIARAIVEARLEAPITTTTQLANIVRRVVPLDRTGIDPATRSFQALRIRVNDELAEIEQALRGSASLLAPGGRLVVVAFHSLEDRLIKRFMGGAAGRNPLPSRYDPGGLKPRRQAAFRLLTTRALRPTQDELTTNRRARSARLRALERIAP